MIRQDLRNWEWVIVIDPHGDLARDVMPFIPRERADDVIYFNPSDLDRPMWLNMLEAHTDEEKELVAMDALNIMIKLFWNEVFGPRIQDYFRNAVLTLMDYPGGWAITDVVRLFTDEDFQKDHVRHIKNPIVKNWWEKTGGKKLITQCEQKKKQKSFLILQLNLGNSSQIKWWEILSDKLNLVLI